MIWDQQSSTLYIVQISNSWNDNNGNYVHATMGCVYEGQKHYIIHIIYLCILYKPRQQL